MAKRRVTQVERRARLGRRHALAAQHRVGTPEAATAAMTVLHATEAPSVYLSVAARTEGVTVADVDRALYDDRSLVKQLAMRRTLFVFPRDLLPGAWGAPSARVADVERRKLVRNVVDDGRAADGQAWLDQVGEEVERLLAAEGALSARQVREALPALDGKVTVSATSPWGGPVPLAPRVLTLLGASGRITRGRNAGHWRVNRPAWTLMSSWLGAVPDPLSAREGYAELVGRWLRTFGPGTEADLVWWLGSTKTAVRLALADVDAVEVGLEGGSTGWLLPDDLEPEPELAPWAALLPTLDPTTMGWRDRDFYLDPSHTAYLFDSNGNGGTTIWWDGRIVGCWVQDPGGVVVPVLREDIGAEGAAAVAVEAERLTAWLGGEVIGSVYASAQMKQARLP
ncbi:winged helix DNA-binding domain-containing protein [Ornithinimicrobium cryptoxanthini]|uniref:Winged helix DNA-binding domain-containing protein n=1 Tax=Ornithinimicrobium cryptoxanthini TaxID=2934161 RepID=A0ABY4YHQ1_9MICO|nr:winged helix DNA-binding domain-containing protein [Ornithinimicrobium cryptoxanthini]USQ76157.1 winged helix DNA-binding domain-containing protein [Ornithinimicrobium cryptoxanthini]